MSETAGRPQRVVFTKEMRRDYTILVPMMAPILFELVKNIMQNAGYRVELLTNCSHQVVQEGLKYVHNDTCYPALLVIGQMIDALNSGKYDLEKTALLMSQTGGGCRASNYIHLLRKAVQKAGYGQLPVISANLSGLEENPGFQITLSLVRKLIVTVVYSDVLMLLSNQTRPYENEKGAADALVQRWIKALTGQFNAGRGLGFGQLKTNLEAIVRDFEALPITRTPKVKVGVVGEIYVKYARLANNDLESFLASQDCEVMVPGILNFMLFKVDNRLEDCKLYGGGLGKKIAAGALMKLFIRMESIMLEVLNAHPQFTAPFAYHRLKGLVKDVIGYGNKMGEGWLLTAEMAELAEQGYGNIVCTQPFGCLPNHICGKGMMHRLREIYGDRANIVAIDYDPSATRVNQENRIKLMLAVARERLAAQQQPGGDAAREHAARPHETAHIA